jgi:hypothetical protein
VTRERNRDSGGSWARKQQRPKSGVGWHNRIGNNNNLNTPTSPKFDFYKELVKNFLIF